MERDYSREAIISGETNTWNAGGGRSHAPARGEKVIAKNRDVQKKWLESEEEPSVNE
jgi:hypothetical protein